MASYQAIVGVLACLMLAAQAQPNGRSYRSPSDATATAISNNGGTASANAVVNDRSENFNNRNIGKSMKLQDDSKRKDYDLNQGNYQSYPTAGGQPEGRNGVEIPKDNSWIPRGSEDLENTEYNNNVYKGYDVQGQRQVGKFSTQSPFFATKQPKLFLKEHDDGFGVRNGLQDGKFLVNPGFSFLSGYNPGTMHLVERTHTFHSLPTITVEHLPIKTRWFSEAMREQSDGGTYGGLLNLYDNALLGRSQFGLEDSMTSRRSSMFLKGSEAGFRKGYTIGYTRGYNDGVKAKIRGFPEGSAALLQRGYMSKLEGLEMNPQYQEHDIMSQRGRKVGIEEVRQGIASNLERMRQVGEGGVFSDLNGDSQSQIAGVNGRQHGYEEKMNGYQDQADRYGNVDDRSSGAGYDSHMMGPAYMNPANRGGNSVATAKSNGGGHASATAVTNGNGNANANSIANGNPNDYNDMPGNYDHLNNNANSNAVATAVSNGGGNAVASATSNGHGDAVATATSNTDHFDNRNGNTGIDVDNELDSSFKSRSASPDEEIEVFTPPLSTADGDSDDGAVKGDPKDVNIKG